MEGVVIVGSVLLAFWTDLEGQPDVEEDDMKCAKGHQRLTGTTLTALYNLRLSGLLLLACLGASAQVGAQQRIDPMAATAVQMFSAVAWSFTALADAMPADRWSFKPTEGEFSGVRTFAEQVKHVACSNFGFFNQVEKIEPPESCGTGGPHPATTKAELMTYLRESFQYADRVLRMTTSANALDPVSGPYGGDRTRLGLAALALWHASDHYGQLVVYLRMNGLVPPASQARQ